MNRQGKERAHLEGGGKPQDGTARKREKVKEKGTQRDGRTGTEEKADQ